VDYSTRDLQQLLTSAQVLQILQEGNERFRTGKRLTRDLNRQLQATAVGQHPLAVVLSCIDSRTPAELIFDLGLGDVFSVRIAGNIISEKVLGSMEYGCAVAGAKLIVVIGHTQCGAVTAAVNFAGSPTNTEQATGCQHLEPIIHEIQMAMDQKSFPVLHELPEKEKADFVNSVARQNVLHTVERILSESRTISRLVREGRINVIGAIYDIVTGRIEFFTEEAAAVRSAAAS
jgi:carbonic anhydrase